MFFVGVTVHDDPSLALENFVAGLVTTLSLNLYYILGIFIYTIVLSDDPMFNINSGSNNYHRQIKCTRVEMAVFAFEM